ncbi:MAG: hypothetical protein ABI944_07065 [Chthoniobacterales bacterium]
MFSNPAHDVPVSSETDEIYQVAPDVYGWSRYDRSVKADLSSTALLTSRGLLLIDPIALQRTALEKLTAQLTVGGVVLTNENHERDAAAFAQKFSAPIFALSRASASPDSLSITPVDDGDKLTDDLTVIAIPGAGAGEMALHFDSGGGTVVMGDALINFEPHGFGFLPAKYCSDSKQLRTSLLKLLDYSFERMLFAHGTPIASGASARLKTLLQGELR